MYASISLLVPGGVSVHEGPNVEPDVHDLLEPFNQVALLPDQTSVPLNLAEFLAYAGPPRRPAASRADGCLSMIFTYFHVSCLSTRRGLVFSVE